MNARSSIYEQVVAITEELVGPASERFVARQIINHLHKNPNELTREDIGQLIDWLRLSASLLSDDQAIVTKYIDNLVRLSRKRSRQ